MSSRLRKIFVIFKICSICWLFCPTWKMVGLVFKHLNFTSDVHVFMCMCYVQLIGQNKFSWDFYSYVLCAFMCILFDNIKIQITCWKSYPANWTKYFRRKKINSTNIFSKPGLFWNSVMFKKPTMLRFSKKICFSLDMRKYLPPPHYGLYNSFTIF